MKDWYGKGMSHVNCTLKQLQGWVCSLFPWTGSTSGAQHFSSCCWWPRSQVERTERWELGLGPGPKMGFCSVPGTKFISGCCSVQHWDRLQMLSHKICRLKTEILKAVCKEELNLYCLPSPLFNDSKPKCSALGLVCHSSGTLMTPVQCRDTWAE